MAAPSSTTTLGDFVVLSTAVSAGVFTSTDLILGTVESIGADVTEVAIGDQVLFINEYSFIVSSSAYLVTQEKNIILIYTPAP